MPSEHSERGHPNKRQSDKVTTKPAGELQQSKLQHLFGSPRRTLGPPRDDVMMYNVERSKTSVYRFFVAYRLLRMTCILVSSRGIADAVAIQISGKAVKSQRNLLVSYNNRGHNICSDRHVGPTALLAMTPRSMVIIHYELFIIHFMQVFSPRIAQHLRLPFDGLDKPRNRSKSTQESFGSTLGLSKTFIEQHIPRPTRGKKGQFGRRGRRLETKKPGCRSTPDLKEKIRFGRGEGFKESRQKASRAKTKSRAVF